MLSMSLTMSARRIKSTMAKKVHLNNTMTSVELCGPLFPSKRRERHWSQKSSTLLAGHSLLDTEHCTGHKICMQHELLFRHHRNARQSTVRVRVRDVEEWRRWCCSVQGRSWAHESVHCACCTRHGRRSSMDDQGSVSETTMHVLYARHITDQRSQLSEENRHVPEQPCALLHHRRQCQVHAAYECRSSGYSLFQLPDAASVPAELGEDKHIACQQSYERSD